MTLLCTYHHTMLHEGGFSIVSKADDTLRFITADGRTIPRGGYRPRTSSTTTSAALDENPSREGLCAAELHRCFAQHDRMEAQQPNDVRECRVAAC